LLFLHFDDRQKMEIYSKIENNETKVKGERLRNYTQSYVAEQLNISVSGYGKIERNETDISLSRLMQISKILETDFNTILNFDKQNVFNLQHNNIANAIVQNQQILDKPIDDRVKRLEQDNLELKKSVETLIRKVNL